MRKKTLNLMSRLIVCLCAVLTSTTAFAEAQWLGNSYIYIDNNIDNNNSKWYRAHGQDFQWTNGKFDGYDFGAISSLAIGGQLEIGDNGNNWGGGDGDWMHYKIDDGAIISGDIHLAYESYGYGDYYNNMRFLSGGGNFTTTSININSLAPGSHTLTVWFGPVEGVYELGLTSPTYYTAKFGIAGDISGATVTGVEASYDWTGDVIHPVPVLTVGGAVLSATDYDVTYSEGCTLPGNYNVTISGKGYCTGSIVVPFTINNAYLLVGTMNGWTCEPSYKLIKNENSDFEEYFIEGITLSMTDEFKVKYLSGGGYDALYPDGTDNNYGQNGEIESDGTYTIYFRPNGDGGEDWFYNILHVVNEDIEVSLAPTGYGTFYNNRDVTLPAGVVAYVMNDATPTYEKIADGDGDGTTVKKTIPADVAVLLYSASKPSKITLTKKAFNSDYRTFTNLLKGSDVETTTTGGATYYKLTYGNDNTTFGWYWGEDGGAAFTSPAHKAWLALPAGARPFLSLPGDDFTGIATIENKQQNDDNVWYDLNGRRINAPVTKGIYINDGRKIVIK